MKVFISLLITFSIFAGGNYRANEIFSENDVRDLVERYYQIHDKRENVSQFLKLLAPNGLYMLMGSEVHSKKQFKKWLRRTRILSKKVRHTIVDLDIQKSEDGSYIVDSCINYKGKLRLGFKFNKTDRITWKLVESLNQKDLLIKEYIVYDGCK